MLKGKFVSMYYAVAYSINNKHFFLGMNMNDDDEMNQIDTKRQKSTTRMQNKEKKIIT